MSEPSESSTLESQTSSSTSQATPEADPTSTRLVHQWKYDSPLLSCRFDPTGRYVFGGCEDHSVQRWELPSGDRVAMKAHDSWVRSIEFSSDGQEVVTGGFDGRLVWWPATEKTPRPIRTVQGHDGWIRAISRSHDGRLLASCGNDNLVKLWNLNTGELVRQFEGHTKHVYSVLAHDNGKTLLSGDLAGQVIQWEGDTGKKVRTFDAKPLHTYNGGQRVDFGGVRTMAINPDQRYLACGGLHKATNPLGAVHEPLVMVFDWQSGKLVGSHVADEIKGGVVWRVLFRSSTQMVSGSGGSSGGFILFWNVDAEKDVHRFKLPNLARDLDLHPDGLQLATAHHDKHIRISTMQKQAAS